MRSHASLFVALLACAVLVGAAHAQSAYPNRPIRFIAPFPPGGSTDVLCRLLGSKLAEGLAQPVTVDNRPGASGNIGHEAAAKAAPDGYTILISSSSTLVNNVHLFKSLRYDPLGDFTPVSMVASAGQVLVVHPSVPAKSVSELIALAKAQPAKLNFGSGGKGIQSHISGEMFKSAVGIDIVHIPYKGTVQAVGDLVAGQVQLVFSDMVPRRAHHDRVGRARLRGRGVVGRDGAQGNPRRGREQVERGIRADHEASRRPGKIREPRHRHRVQHAPARDRDDQARYAQNGAGAESGRRGARVVRVGISAGAAAALLACTPVAAQSPDQYPSRPIRYIVASAPGGIADITPRVLGPRLSQALHQPVVIENRPAGGIVAGGETVAKAAPDGYTLLSATPQVAIVQSMVKDLAFDPRRDLAPIALVGLIPNVLVAGPRTPAKTLAELIELARRNPGKLNYSSTGAGTSVHLSAELLKYYAGVDIVHVPYRGAAAAMTALLAGDVDIMVDSVPPSLPHIRAGRVRALAVTSARRAPQLPEVPTMIESGYPDFEMNGWSGVVTTAGTPAGIIARLEAEIKKALSQPQVVAAYENAGLTVRFMGAAEFGKFWDAEIAKFALAIRHSGAVKE